MRRRRQRKPILPTQNLDSFLDILTNTVGVLMFISLFITLVAVEAGDIIRTPLVSYSRKNPYFFEVRNDKIIYINDQEINRQIGYLVDSLPECSRPNIPSNLDVYSYQYYLDEIQEFTNCRENLVQQIQSFRGQTDNYTVRFYDANALIYEPLSSKVGESKEEISGDESQFSQILEQLNPQTDYIAFIVRPDSFAAFRTARNEVLDRGFNVGWEPHESDNPIVFGSGGRSVGIQ